MTAPADVLLAFLSTGCAECRGVWEELATSPLEPDLGRLPLVIVTPSRSMEDARLARQLTPTGAHLHMGSETWFAYGVAAAGTFVLVRPEPGRPPPWEQPAPVLGSGTPRSAPELAACVRRWQDRASGRRG